MMDNQVTLYDNHDNWKVILIDEKKVVLYNKCDGVVDVVKKPPERNKHAKCPFCHRDMPPSRPGTPTPPFNNNNNSPNNNSRHDRPSANPTFAPNYFQLLYSSHETNEDESPGLNAGYYHRFFQEESKIGSGGFGSVYKCRHVINGIDLGEYAVKKVPMGSDIAWQKRVIAEVQNLQMLQKHPNIIGYKHSWMEQDQPAHFGPPVPCLFILMEYANGGNLEDYINQRYLSDHEVWRFFVDLCRGLGYLHHCGILHRDIKCNNILLSNTFDAVTGTQVTKLVISDFGTSSNILTGTPLKRTGNTGTVEYLAPELLGMNAMGEYNPYTEKCDLWALGILLYKLCFATYPYPSANHDDREISEVLGEIAAFEGIVLPRHDRDPELIKLILQLLRRDPQNRPSVVEIFQNPYVKQMIYTPPSSSSVPPHSSVPSSSSSPPPSVSSLRLRRTLTPNYPLLLEDNNSSSHRPSSPPTRKKPLSLVQSLLAHTRPKLQQLGTLLTTFPLSSILYMFIFLVHICICFQMFSPYPPPLSFVLPVMALSLFGLNLRKDVPRHMRIPIFVLQLLYEIVFCEFSHSIAMFSSSNVLYTLLLAALGVLYVIV